MWRNSHELEQYISFENSLKCFSLGNKLLLIVPGSSKNTKVFLILAGLVEDGVDK